MTEGLSYKTVSHSSPFRVHALLREDLAWNSTRKFFYLTQM